MYKKTAWRAWAGTALSCFFTLCATAATRQHVLDSLTTALNRPQADTVKVRILLSLSEQYRDTAIIPALSYAAEADRMAARHSWMPGRIKAALAAGACYDRVQQWDKALASYYRAIKLAQAAHSDADLLQSESAISETYNAAGQLDSNLHYKLQTLQLARQFRDTVAEIRMLTNLGGFYKDHSKDYERALYYWKAAALLAGRSLGRRYHALALNNIADAYMLLGRMDSAYGALQLGLASLTGKSTHYSHTFLLATLAEWYQQQDRNTEAIIANEAALAEAQAPGGARVIREDALLRLSALYETTGRPAAALQYYKHYTALHDSNRTAALTNEDATAVLKHDFAIQAAAGEIERSRLLATDKQRQYALTAAAIGLLVLALSAGIAFYLLLQNRKKARTIARQAAHLQARTDALQRSLQEKELLMKEIHHRVKNNLQVISALQGMQAARSNEPGVKAALEDSQNRVLSIAFLHHNLYQHEDLNGVEMRSFAQELTSHILEVCGVAEKAIEVVQDIIPLTLDIDTAVPLGLIINELLTNSCKHAFKSRDGGTILVRLRATGNGIYELVYEDDGPGLDTSIDFEKAGSLGLKLISQLSEQLDGAMQYTRSPKSRFMLAFKDFETRNAD